MLKINAALPVDPAAIATISGQTETTDGPEASGAAALRSKVELLADGNIKLLLDALGKTMGEFNKLSGKLPPAVAREAANHGRAAMGADTALPRGLAAMVRGARSGGETLAAFAQTMADAAILSEHFPEGIRPETVAAAKAFAQAAGTNGVFQVRLMAIVRQLIDTPKGETAALALARAMLADMPEDLQAQVVREDIAKAAAALSRSIPERVRQAAVFHNLPELEETVVWQKVADSLPWLQMPKEALEQASRTLREMAAAAPALKESAAETPGGQKVLVLTMPVFFADGRSYPAYIHISRDREQADNPAAPPQETWLRMCVATDHIGAVDMVFHLRGQQQISIRVTFANREVGEEFRGVLPELRGALAESDLVVADVAIATMTEK